MGEKDEYQLKVVWNVSVLQTSPVMHSFAGRSDHWKLIQPKYANDNYTSNGDKTHANLKTVRSDPFDVGSMLNYCPHHGGVMKRSLLHWLALKHTMQVHTLKASPQ